MLREVISPEFPMTYCGKLFDIASTCTNIASSLVENVEGRRNARSKPTPPEQPNRSIHTNPFLNPPHQLGSVVTPGLSTNLPVHPIIPPYGNRLGSSGLQSQPQLSPLAQYPMQSNGSSPAAFIPNRPGHSLPPQSSSLSPAQQQQEGGSGTSPNNPLADIDFTSFASFGEGMMDFNNANFGAFDFDMDELWGDPELLEEMARDTNLAVMADGYV
jgi:hypothetical protein